MQNVGTNRQHMEMCGNRDSVQAVSLAAEHKDDFVCTKQGKEC